MKTASNKLFGLALMMAAPWFSSVMAQNTVETPSYEWQLVWSDEFNNNGPLDSTVWNYENGFVRNQENQWYQPENVYCRDGKLIIEARNESDNRRKNPEFVAGSKDWKKSREFIDYTSGSVNTKGKMDFRYGRLEVKAKIHTAEGAWPAIWLLGNDMEWPSNGEIDVMEYYRINGVPHILANACWGNDKHYDAIWNSSKIPFSHFTDRDSLWAEKFQIWRMDWDENAIKLYLDDELLNEIPLASTINGNIGHGSNPFRMPQYLLLNLAIGGINGGPIVDSKLPMKYEIDYARVYKRKTDLAAYEGEKIAEEGAWCWFADPRAIRHVSKDGKYDKSYVGYIDNHGNIKAMQYDFKSDSQDEVLIRSYFQPDDHNNPTFLVLPDERVMVFYSRHTDEPCFYYRVTKEPADLKTLGDEKILATANNTTYPSPFILSDDPDHIYLCWRGINWHPTIAKLSLPDASDDVKVEWGPYQIVQSTVSRPYAKYSSNGKDRIRLAYTTGHPDNEMPNFLYYNEIDINGMTLQDICGKPLSNIGKEIFKVNKKDEYVVAYPNTVVDSTSGFRDWVWQVEADNNGNPVIAMARISPDKNKHEYYYARWDGKNWQKTFLANAGGHFHQTPNHEKCYSGGIAIDPDNVDKVYCSVPIDGKNGEVYEILKFTLGKDGNIVSEEAITRNSALNNVRPYVIAESEGNPLRLVWMNGKYYDWIVSDWKTEGYATSINSEFAGFPERQDKSVMLPTKAPKFDKNKPFDYVIEVIPSNIEKSGCIADFGKLRYMIDKETLKPEIRYRKQTFRSSNKLASSDVWKTQRRGTSGKWYSPDKSEMFKVRLKYDGKWLETYVNGLLDQRVELRK